MFFRACVCVCKRNYQKRNKCDALWIRYKSTHPIYTFELDAEIVAALSRICDGRTRVKCVHIFLIIRIRVSGP